MSFLQFSFFLPLHKINRIMTKKLNYLFVICLFGTTCMANAGSHTEVTPKEILPEGKVLHTKEEQSSKKKLTVPMIPLCQDIKNHPFAGIAAVVLAELFVFVINMNFFGSDDLAFFAPLPSDSITRWTILGRQLWIFLTTVIFVGVLSLLLASWTSRWRNDDSKKEEVFTTPSFAARLWRSFRFMLFPFIISIVWTIPHIFEIDRASNFLYAEDQKLARFILVHGLGPALVYLGTYLAIVAYDYNRKRKDKKKKDLVANS